MDWTNLLSISLGAILINNFILVQFLGCCPFLGVSKKMDTAVGMGFAVIFVMGLASAFCYVVNLLLVALDLEFMQTVAFILVIAALVQFVEMFLQKMIPSLYEALGVYLHGASHSLSTRVNERHHHACMFEIRITATGTFRTNIADLPGRCKFFRRQIVRFLLIEELLPFLTKNPYLCLIL